MNDPDRTEQSPPREETNSCSNACGLTDVGRKRAENQDQFLIAQLRKSMLVNASSLPISPNSNLFGETCGQLLMVADGMGGHAAGQKASSLAMDQLILDLLNTVHWFLRSDEQPASGQLAEPKGKTDEQEFVDSLKGLLHQAHDRILTASEIDESQRGMGTTLTMAYIIGPKMYVVHAGDSRCYLIRDNVCEQITTDHTLAHQLVEAGGLKPEEEADSRWGNVLWNVLGGHGKNELTAEVRLIELEPDDTVLLCSDGLSRYLSAEAIANVFAETTEDLHSVCHHLVGLANGAGGEDNVTVVVAKPTPAQSQPFGCGGPPETADDESDLKSENEMPISDFFDEDTLPE